jgi:ATP-dependent Lhr-like helicase
VPDAFLEPVPTPLDDLVLRYARTHGPFTIDAVAARFGASEAAIDAAAGRLLRAGRLVEGAFLPHGRGRELCEAEVLAALRRKSLAKLRRAVEPVDAAAFARFLPEWQGIASRARGPDALLSAIAQLEGAPLVASTIDAEVLPSRIDGYQPWDLDMLCASGEIAWCGVESIGPSDGRIALYLADHEPLLAPPPRVATTELASKVRDVLARRGAVFFADIAREVGGFPNDVLEAIWDLVWAGEVTNDTLEPLRSRIRGTKKDDHRRGRPGRPRAPRTGPPGSEGRWSLRSSRGSEAPSETEKSAALARSLLDRYGIVMREAVHAEGIAGGFGAVYGVLKAMEDAGRVRRGYFIAGRGGLQFALPGADERLRSKREASEAPRALVLAATDPANAFGAAIPWPDRSDDLHAQRAAGALVVLYDGELLAWLGKSEQTLLTFLPDGTSAASPQRGPHQGAEPVRGERAETLAQSLAALVSVGRRRALLITSIDGAPAAQHPIARAMIAAGFAPSQRGLLKRSHDTTGAWSRRDAGDELRDS